MHSNQSGSTSLIYKSALEKEVVEGFKELEKELSGSLKIQSQKGNLIKSTSYEGSIDSKEVHEGYANFIEAYNAYKNMMTLKLNALQGLVGTDAYPNYENALRKEFEGIDREVKSLVHGSQGRMGIKGALKEFGSEPGAVQEHARKRLADMAEMLTTATAENPFALIKANQKKMSSLKSLNEKLNKSMDELVSSFNLVSMNEYESRRKEKEADFIKIFEMSLRQESSYVGIMLINMFKVDNIDVELGNLNNGVGRTLAQVNADWLIAAILKEMFAQKGGIFTSEDIYNKIKLTAPHLAKQEVENIIGKLVPRFRDVVKKCEEDIKNRVKAKVNENDQVRKIIGTNKSNGDYEKINLEEKITENFKGIKPEETDKFFLENPDIFFYFLLQENNRKGNNIVISNLFDSCLKDEAGFNKFIQLCKALNANNEANIQLEINNIIPDGSSGKSGLIADQQQAKEFLAGSYENFKKLLLRERASNLRKKIGSNEEITALLKEMIASYEANQNNSRLKTPLSEAEIILFMPYYIISCMKDEKYLVNDDDLITIFSTLLTQLARLGNFQEATSEDVKSDKAVQILRLLNENKSAILEKLQDVSFVQVAEPIKLIKPTAVPAEKPLKAAFLPISSEKSSRKVNSESLDSKGLRASVETAAVSTLPDQSAEVVVHFKASSSKIKLAASVEKVAELTDENTRLAAENAAYRLNTSSEASNIRDEAMNQRLDLAQKKTKEMEQEQSRLTENNADLAKQLSAEKGKNKKNQDAINDLGQKLNNETGKVAKLTRENGELEVKLGQQYGLVEGLETQVHQLTGQLAAVNSELDTVKETKDNEIAQLKRDKDNLEAQLQASKKETATAIDLATQSRTTGVKRAVAVVVTVGALVCIGAILAAVFFPFSAPVSVPTAIATFKLTTATVSVLMGSAGAALVAAGLVPGLIAHFKEKSHLKECTTFKDTLAGGAARVSDNTTSVSVAR